MIFRSDRRRTPATRSIHFLEVNMRSLSRPARVAVLASTCVLVAMAKSTHPALSESWPQRFEVPENASFGFVVTEPGPIVVTAEWQGGAALPATLRGPLAKPVAQSGTGHLQISYQATATDVKNGSLWAVTFASPAAPLTRGGASAAIVGTVSVK